MLDASKYTFLESTASTNTQMVEMLQKPLPEGFILQTGFQSKGKGQGTNSWESEPGKNLLFSTLFYPRFLPPAKQFLLSKAVALALVEVFNELHPGFQLKWPNDIYYRDKKLAGILIETAIMGSKLEYAIVGMGINVNQVVFHDAPNPVSLQQILNKELDVQALLQDISIALANEYAFLQRGYVDGLNKRYEKHLFRREGTWKFKDADGLFEASIENVEEEGRLILKTISNEIRRYWMKEVEFVL